MTRGGQQVVQRGENLERKEEQVGGGEEREEESEEESEEERVRRKNGKKRGRQRGGRGGEHGSFNKLNMSI